MAENRGKVYFECCGYHGLFLKRNNLSNRQDAKVAKASKIAISACVETTFGKLGVLGVLAVKNAAHVRFQEKTMLRLHQLPDHAADDPFDG